MTDAPRYWEPLTQLRSDQMFRRPEVTAETAKHYGISMEEAAALLDREAAKCLYFTNKLYQVEVSRVSVDWFGRAMDIAVLSIRRRDGAMIWDWRHFQQIKNELLGPEIEGMQLFPAESRKVDTSNKWSIFALMDGTRLPLGWQKRDVQDKLYEGVPGLRQRAL